ncbi:MAG TPA: hypothetical protein VFF06_12150 [Polyangia bacterium]|nr:hypothetical protein [Polyangia bacterium]
MDTQAIAGLDWYLDFARARTAAQASGRAILSLRLLGRLDEELSCANSRFFRTLLYPDRAVAARLRERFVLHWSTERPAPRLTIDFGDGRRLERTVTGNSAHYVLDARGRVVDALPGLFDAPTFLRLLDEAGRAALEAGALDGKARALFVQRWHRAALERLLAAWSAELRALGLPPLDAASVDDATWTRLAHARGAPIAESPSARDAGRLAPTKMALERPLLDALLPRGASVVEDTLRNQFDLHRRVHARFAAGEAGNFAALNDWIYRELFLTPADDPWLGLRPPHAFAALAGG